MRRWGGIVGILATITALIGAGAANGSTDRARRDHGPFDRSYVIAALSTPTGRSPIRTLRDVEISFASRRVRAHVVRSIGWSAHCNSIGGKLRLRAHRLISFEVVSTLIGCEPAAEREDRWLGRFFGTRPHWALRGDRLVLRGSLGTMTLRPGTAPPGPP